jgi:hypothetical protein
MRNWKNTERRFYKLPKSLQPAEINDRPGQFMNYIAAIIRRLIGRHYAVVALQSLLIFGERLASVGYLRLWMQASDQQLDTTTTFDFVKFIFQSHAHDGCKRNGSVKRMTATTKKTFFKKLVSSILSRIDCHLASLGSQ